MDWLISANPSVYDHSRSFSEHGFIDWKQGKNKFQVGDVVYIYVSKPDMHLRFKCKVEAINLTSKNIRDDREYWVNPLKYDASCDGLFFRLKLLKRTNSNLLALNQLLQNGLKAAPQSPKKLQNPLLGYIETNFELLFQKLVSDETDKVKESRALTKLERDKKIKRAPKKPNRIAVTSYIYERSADIIAEALIRADGNCEKCNSPAPFIRKKDDTPYLEVHHVVSLSEGGDDSMENVLAICPNCHREEHYGK